MTDLEIQEKMQELDDAHIYNLLIEYNKSHQYPLVYFMNLSEFNSKYYSHKGFLDWGTIKESFDRLESKGLIKNVNAYWHVCTPYEIAQRKCKK